MPLFIADPIERGSVTSVPKLEGSDHLFQASSRPCEVRVGVEDRHHGISKHTHTTIISSGVRQFLGELPIMVEKDSHAGLYIARHSGIVKYSLNRTNRHFEHICDLFDSASTVNITNYRVCRKPGMRKDGELR